jgi:hypothetical protein
MLVARNTRSPEYVGNMITKLRAKLSEDQASNPSIDKPAE